MSPFYRQSNQGTGKLGDYPKADSKGRADIQTQVCGSWACPSVTHHANTHLKAVLSLLGGPWVRGCQRFAVIWFLFHVSSFPACKGATAKVLVRGMCWKECVLLPLLPLTLQALQIQTNILRSKAGVNKLHRHPLLAFVNRVLLKHSLACSLSAVLWRLWRQSQAQGGNSDFLALCRKFAGSALRGGATRQQQRSPVPGDCTSKRRASSE